MMPNPEMLKRLVAQDPWARTKAPTGVKAYVSWEYGRHAEGLIALAAILRGRRERRVTRPRHAWGWPKLRTPAAPAIAPARTSPTPSADGS